MFRLSKISLLALIALNCSSPAMRRIVQKIGNCASYRMIFPMRMLSTKTPSTTTLKEKWYFTEDARVALSNLTSKTDWEKGLLEAKKALLNLRLGFDHTEFMKYINDIDHTYPLDVIQICDDKDKIGHKVSINFGALRSAYKARLRFLNLCQTKLQGLKDIEDITSIFPQYERLVFMVEDELKRVNRGLEILCGNKEDLFREDSYETVREIKVDPDNVWRKNEFKKE